MSFRSELTEFVSKNEPNWRGSMHIPDELLDSICDEQDLGHFAAFLAENLDIHRYVEAECNTLEGFLRNLSDCLGDERVLKRAKERGIISQLGVISYCALLAVERCDPVDP